MRRRVQTRTNQDAATSPETLAAQYADGDNLRSRISIYDYLERVGESPDTLERWVLDHVAWRASMTAADVGCGPGPYLAELSVRAARVVALDLSPGMLRDASIRFAASRRPSVVVADAQRLPLPDRSVDVVLCAHMLYHVPDIDAAVAEFRRVLAPGGTLLVVLNGPDDKAEIRTLWRDAALSVSEAAFTPPHWGDRANLDNAPEMLGAHFPSVTVDRLRGVFRFPAAGPPLTWVESLRPGTEHLVADAGWTAVNARIRERIEEIVARDGEFRVSQQSGVIVAR
ncbi:MAG TPA: class I SAM-dependent methyltransferase [Acidimicrobiales bacterium]|nr:class I SAM-dependent methyltransferase [Acidimicrobiales bacterium]